MRRIAAVASNSNVVRTTVNAPVRWASNPSLENLDANAVLVLGGAVEMFPTLEINNIGEIDITGLVSGPGDLHTTNDGFPARSLWVPLRSRVRARSAPSTSTGSARPVRRRSAWSSPATASACCTRATPSWAGSACWPSISGRPLGTGYDQLAVTSNVALQGGPLFVNLGYHPTPGQTFTNPQPARLLTLLA